MADENVVPDYIIQRKLAQLGDILNQAKSPSTSISDIVRGPSPMEISPDMSGPTYKDVDKPFTGPNASSLSNNASSLSNNASSITPIKATQVQPITAANQGPYTQQYVQQILPNAPNPNDYQPKHKVIGTILAGLAGAGGYTKAGQEWRQGPYNRALEAWQNRIKSFGPLIQNEAKIPSLQAGVNRENAQLGQKADIANMTNQQRTQHEAEVANARRQELERKLAQDAINNDLNRQKVANALKALQIKQNNPQSSTIEKNLAGSRRSIDAEMAANPGITREQAINNIERDLAPTSIYTNPIAAGLTAGAKTTAELQAKSSPEGISAQNKIDTEKTRLYSNNLQARINTEKSLLTPAAEAINNAPTDPMNPNNRIQMLSRYPTSTQAKLIENGMIQPTRVLKPDEIRRIGNATNTFNHITGIESLLEDPNIKPNELFGPLKGRITRAKHYIGMDLTKATPEEVAKNGPIFNVDSSGLSESDPAYRLLTNFNNLLIWEVNNAAGNRPAHQLFDRLQQYSARPEEGVRAIKGTLSGIRDNVYNTVSTYYGVNPATIKGSAQSTTSPDNNKKKSVLDSIQWSK